MNTKFELINAMIPQLKKLEIFLTVPQKSKKQQTLQNLCFEIQSGGGSGAGVGGAGGEWWCW